MASAPPSLGTRIRRARERAKMSQEDLATAVDASVRAVGDWENDRTKPRNRLGAIEAALDVSLEEAPAEDDLSDFGPGEVKAIRDSIPDKADQDRVFLLIRVMRNDPELFAELVRQARSGRSPGSGEGSGGRRYREDRAG